MIEVRKEHQMTEGPYRNDVLLAGRLSSEPVLRTLTTSGDKVLTWRLIIDRPRAECRTSRKVVDTFTCVSFDPGLVGPAREWRPGDMLEVRGALRRRFWPGGGSHEIMVKGVKTMARGGWGDRPGSVPSVGVEEAEDQAGAGLGAE